MIQGPTLAALLLPLLAAPAAADLLTGQVVDANGVGVPGVDIDVQNLGSGGDPDVFNDGTDANGFFSTTVEAGVYRVLFKPPPPPVTTHLTGIVEDVVLIGTSDLGVISLAPGVGVTGRVVDDQGFPLANVDLDVTDLVTGTSLVLKNARTDLFGQFAVATPAGDIHLDFDPAPTTTPNLLPLRRALAPAADLDLGDVTLAPGLALTGRLQDALGQPLPGIDLDVFDATTGAKLFTPHDNSNANGEFSIRVPAGLLDVEICPAFATRLVARDFEGLLVTTDLDLGPIPLEGAVVLGGTVRDAAGTGVAGMDVDVHDATTGLSVVTCGDDTDAAGSYAILVPAGTLDVSFAPPGAHGTSAADLHTGVVVAADAVLDGAIPAPLAALTGSPLSGAPPLTVAFSDLSTGAVTARAWSFGDLGTSTVRHPLHTYTEPGTYTVSLTVDGIGGPSTRTEPGLVVVTPPAPVAAFTGAPLAGPAPLTVAFADQSTGVVTSRSWSFGDLATSTLTDPVHVYTEPGTFTVSLTASGPGGADVETRPGLVVVTAAAAQPVAAFTGAPLAGTAPLTVQFTDLSTGSVTSRLWSFGDFTTSSEVNPQYTYTQPGTYTVLLVASGPEGLDVETKPGYVTVAARPRTAPGTPPTSTFERPAPPRSPGLVREVLRVLRRRR